MSSNGLPHRSYRRDDRWKKDRTPARSHSTHPPGEVSRTAASFRNPGTQRFPPTSAAIVKREDAQPNEDTWTPFRLRRPIQPPLIQTMSSSRPSIPDEPIPGSSGLHGPRAPHRRSFRPSSEYSRPAQYGSPFGRREQAECSSSRPRDYIVVSDSSAAIHHPQSSNRPTQAETGSQRDRQRGSNHSTHPVAALSGHKRFLSAGRDQIIHQAPATEGPPSKKARYNADSVPGRARLPCKKKRDANQASSRTSSSGRPLESGSSTTVDVVVTLRPGLSAETCLILIRSLLSGHGPIKTVCDHVLSGKKASTITAKVVFENSIDARKACSQRRFEVPKRLRHHNNVMLVKSDPSYNPPLNQTLSPTSGTADQSTGSNHIKQPNLKTTTPPTSMPLVVKQDAKRGICSTPSTQGDKDEVDRSHELPGEEPLLTRKATGPLSVPVDQMEVSSDDDVVVLKLMTPAASRDSPSPQKDKNDYVAEGTDYKGKRRASASLDDTPAKSAVENVAPDPTEPSKTSEYASQTVSSPASSDNDQPLVQRTSSVPSNDIISKSKRHGSRSGNALDDDPIERGDSTGLGPVKMSKPGAIIISDDEDEPPDSVPDPHPVPVYDVTFPLPLECQATNPTYVKNRLQFKLDKIRAMTKACKTVLNSLWTEEHLILHMVHDSSSADAHQEPGNTESPHERINDLTIMSDTGFPSGEAERASRSRNSSHGVESIIIPPSGGARSAASGTSLHFTWPLGPRASFTDTSRYPDFQKTLNDFLTTFFRLWEQSRVGLKFLYDRSAVFSNLLAKQGCKPSKVTKSTGWVNISASIARLPALSNDPFENLIVDAWTVPTEPPTVICCVHGAFSEFPKNTKRAFDRSFVLRPVDTDLYPSEGCLGLIKWIVLSDTLTIRRHTAQTTAVISSFKQNSAPEADPLRSTASPELDAGTGVLSDSRRRDTSEDMQMRSTSHYNGRESPTTLASSPNVNVSADPEPTAFPVDFDEATSPAAILDMKPIPEAVNVTPAGHIAELAAQLQEVQSELNRLKSTTRNTNTNSSLTMAGPRPAQTTQSSSNDCFKIRNSFSYLHRGFGVTKKRYLVPTNMDVYLNVSLRGDIVSWHQKDRSKVQLLLSGSSPTDIVESACYSDTHKTLIVGTRASSAVGLATPQVAITTFNQTVSGLACERMLLPQIMHEHGVRATCLLPQACDMEPDALKFVTAGQERKLMIWKVVDGVAEITKRYTEHPSGIQALEMSEQNHMIFSGDSGGRVYQVDVESNTSTLLLGERAAIHWIHANPLQAHTVMVTTASKVPGQQFRLCDVRGDQPAISFGFSRNPAEQGFEPPVETYRKGSLRDYYFAYPTGELGGTMIWDLRSTRTHLVQAGTGIGTQSHLESRRTMVTLEKNTLRCTEFQ
ncbi:hypothetical protein CROQUDRAFT_695915 [Cronartium quercuum f. sp. fusiforme G11]|uniref:NTF2 domain-containing protein n=1 Tax=Cronartium quercuum f. sp. fusiforme G11 TaxID=708437 RepID=A0A9P6NJC0_9BASI|nr:hypothetical protein CROQUDRAFT_695915 [Cronartium quercuum f. sp. fusiforme G11]